MASGVRKHVVKIGETYEVLSKGHYGEGSGAALIKASNPGMADPPPVGKTVIIPDRPPLTNPTPGASTDVGPDELELRVDGKRFRDFVGLDLVETLDAAATLHFSAPQSVRAEFREAFEPLAFRDCALLIGGAHVFTGTLLNPDPGTNAAEGPMISAGAYSRCGVLGDCTMPASAYPLQYKGVSLAVIAQDLCLPFSISVEVQGDIGEPFRRVRLKSTQKPFDLLKKLAHERKVLLSSTATGGLLLRQPPAVGPAVARLVDGVSPLESIKLSTAPQKVFSHMTVLRKKARRVTSSAYTIQNPALIEAGVLRPGMFRSEDTNSPSELPAAAEAFAGRMQGDAAKWSCKVATWRDANGDRWAPGATVNVQSDPAFLPNPTDLIIRAARFHRTADDRSATLELVLPGSFSGELTDKFPWQG